ncbi:hypothetical protein ACFYKX_02975 [Cytobacillus sp. FJAT-54145]|uniref:Uncharacterized protein n=1 Tax=Cytobacillus spartinae TaxID=3299023 RepID=A0ABW6K5Z1_9BACI
MTKKEAFDLLTLIEIVYSYWVMKSEAVSNWLKLCESMDHEDVKRNLLNHVKHSPYPPLLEEIAVFKEGSIYLLDGIDDHQNPSSRCLHEYSQRTERQIHH